MSHWASDWLIYDWISAKLKGLTIVAVTFKFTPTIPKFAYCLATKIKVKSLQQLPSFRFQLLKVLSINRKKTENKKKCVCLALYFYMFLSIFLCIKLFLLAFALTEKAAQYAFINIFGEQKESEITLEPCVQEVLLISCNTVDRLIDINIYFLQKYLQQ